MTFYLSMSNFSLLCSWLTVKFLSFGYSCNIHGFWYFARLQSCKIQVNPQNPTKFTNTHSKMPQNLAEILSNTCLYNIFETYVSYWGLFTCLKLANLSWNFVTEKCKQHPKTKACFKRCATTVLSWLECRSTAARH